MNAEALPLRARWYALAPACLLALGGCGLKGPLYLPERESQEVVTPAPASTESPRKRPVRPLPAPQSQKDQDDEQTSEPAAEPEDASRTTPPPGR